MSTSRSVLSRVQQIHQCLSRPGAFANAEELSNELEVSRRTTMRDIEYLRDQLGYPIRTARRGDRHGYYYEPEELKNWEKDPKAGLRQTQAMAFSLLFAQQAVARFSGTPFAEPLNAACQSFARELGEIYEDHVPTAECISIREFATEHPDTENFEYVHRAIRQRKRLGFRYRAGGVDESARREVEPYHLTYSFYRWYLVARKPKEGVFRTYALARMEDVEVLRKTFARRKEFRIDDYLKGSFGIITGDALHEVVVDFGPSKAALIRERIWHPSQQLEELDGGGVRLKMKLSSLDEVADWILGWREQARVVSPKVLRRKITQAAQAILQFYEEPG